MIITSSRHITTTRAPAEGERPLDSVRRLTNTLRLETGVDLLASPAQARSWLLGEGYQVAALSAEELGAYRSARTALRLLLLRHGRAEEHIDVLRGHLNAEACVELLDGEPVAGIRPRPVPPGLQPLQAILLAFWRSIANGEVERLKLCADERCRVAFYDRSRNRSRTWCTGTECGNRNRVARFRLKSAVDQEAGEAPAPAC